jgi:rhodanese-related sulfurtransferase
MAAAAVSPAAVSPAAVSPVAATAQQIDYAGFEALAHDVRSVRAARLISLSAFKHKAKQDGAVILDARSADAYAAGHIAGAINLPLTDFTAGSLRAILPDPGQPILIYCNNNFSNNRAPVMLKAPPVSLNIQTFINLTAYGYSNVYELGDVISFDDVAVEWVKASG